MKNTKKSLLVSVLSLMLCVAMLLGTTYAWFTDSVTSGVNQIVAGNLDIDVKHTNAKVTTAESIDSKTNLFSDKNGKAMLWEPGAMSYENFTVENLGSLALKYNLALNITGYNEMSETGKNLQEVLKVKILTTPLTSVTRDTVAALDWENDVNTLDQFTKTDAKLLPAGSEAFQIIVYWVPGENDNAWNVNNGSTTTDGNPLFIDFGIKVVATQIDHENDSFNNTYDKDLTLPELSVATASMTKEATDDLKVKTTGAIKTATVPVAAANTVFDDDELNEGINAEEDKTLTLTLNVENKGEGQEGAQKIIDLEINMEAVMTAGDVVNTKNVKQFNDFVVIEYNIGTGKTGVVAKHNGVKMQKLNLVTDTPTDVVNGGYFYNPSDGILTIKTMTFSPFAVSYDMDYWTNSAATAYAKEENKVIEIATAEQLALFGKQYNAGAANLTGATLKLTADLDMSDKIWETVGVAGYKDGKYNNITIDGQGHKISGLNISGKGFLFCTGENCTIKNITFDNCQAIINADSVQHRAIIVSCYVGSNLVFDNVTVSNSIVSGYWGVGMFVGVYGQDETAPNEHVTFNNCSVKNCTAESWPYFQGGFVGLVDNVGANTQITFTGSNLIDGLRIVGTNNWYDYQSNIYCSAEDGIVDTLENVTVKNATKTK